MSFEPSEFVARIGEKLVMEFAYASVAGTPGLIGAARENPARSQLEKLLPAFVCAGSGIVMDSYNSRSPQQDVVFFERDFCPVYSINDTPEATYFPVEGVIAVGEVKSVVDKATLFDALRKLKSAKLLRRYSEKTRAGTMPPLAAYRPFGSGSTFAAVPQDEYDQAKNFRDQIFSFLICKSFQNSADAVLENLTEFGQAEGFEYLPNIIVSLDDGFIQHCAMPEISLQHSPMTANAVLFCPDRPRAFTFLVHKLRQHAREGRSVPLSSLDRYMKSTVEPLPECRVRSYSRST